MNRKQRVVIDPDDLTGRAGVSCEYEKPVARLLSRSLTGDCQARIFYLDGVTVRCV